MNFLLHLFFNNIYDTAYGILGGHEIRMEETPHQVNYGDVCGGVLIHKKWALTTAHCGTGPDYIRIGSRHRLRGPKVKIQTHIQHPKYQTEHEFDYDIQLLELRRRLHFDKQVNSIGISDGEIGQNILVSGWGYQKEKGDYTDVLYQVELHVVSIERCQSIEQAVYNHTLTERMFCAGGTGKDACQGDSGGPAVSSGQLVGLSSFGFGCGRNIPGVYVNVSNEEIRKWIRSYVGA